MIIGFVIWSIVSVIFICIGISCWKSKEAVGFFTFCNAPIVLEENVAKYNHSVAGLWMIVAILLEIIGIPIIFLEQNSPAFIFVVFAVIILIIAMMCAYIRIESKYTER